MEQGVVKTIEKSVSAEVCGIEESKERKGRAGLATRGWGALSSERKMNPTMRVTLSSLWEYSTPSIIQSHLTIGLVRSFYFIVAKP